LLWYQSRQAHQDGSGLVTRKVQSWSDGYKAVGEVPRGTSGSRLPDGDTAGKRAPSRLSFEKTITVDESHAARHLAGKGIRVLRPRDGPPDGGVRAARSAAVPSSRSEHRGTASRMRHLAPTPMGMRGDGQVHPGRDRPAPPGLSGRSVRRTGASGRRDNERFVVDRERHEQRLVRQHGGGAESEAKGGEDHGIAHLLAKPPVDVGADLGEQGGCIPEQRVALLPHVSDEGGVGESAGLQDVPDPARTPAKPVCAPTAASVMELTLPCWAAAQAPAWRGGSACAVRYGTSTARSGPPASSARDAPSPPACGRQAAGLHVGVEGWVSLVHGEDQWSLAAGPSPPRPAALPRTLAAPPCPADKFATLRREPPPGPPPGRRRNPARRRVFPGHSSVNSYRHLPTRPHRDPAAGR